MGFVALFLGVISDLGLAFCGLVVGVGLCRDVPHQAAIEVALVLTYLVFATMESIVRCSIDEQAA